MAYSTDLMTRTQAIHLDKPDTMAHATNFSISLKKLIESTQHDFHAWIRLVRAPSLVAIAQIPSGRELLVAVGTPHVHHATQGLAETYVRVVMIRPPLAEVFAWPLQLQLSGSEPSGCCQGA